MKNICYSLILISLTLSFFACSPLDIDFNDPQDVEEISDAFLTYDPNGNPTDNDDLIELFGEDNIHFGPVPPTWGDSICFQVDGLYYENCIRYVFDTYNNNEPMLAHTDPPVFDPSTNIHLFYDPNQCLFKHKIITRDTYGNNYEMDLEKAYIIGHDSLFTTYYKGKVKGNGNPTVAILISGTLVFDTITTGNAQTVEFKGVRDYLFGKKILAYEYQPTNAYAQGTIEIKKHPGLSPRCEWDAK